MEEVAAEATWQPRFRAELIGVFAGLALGLVAAALLTRFLDTLLFAVKPTDPVTFVATAAVLALTALVACAAPAWRATRVEPAVALRQE